MKPAAFDQIMLAFIETHQEILELVSDLSALRGKGCEVDPEVRNAGGPVPGSRSGANDESAGNRDAGDVKTNHLVAGSGDPWSEHADHATNEARVADGGL